MQQSKLKASLLHSFRFGRFSNILRMLIMILHINGRNQINQTQRRSVYTCACSGVMFSCIVVSFQILMKFNRSTKPGYPFPSMSTLPDMDWPNIWMAGLMLRPDNLYKQRRNGKSNQLLRCILCYFSSAYSQIPDSWAWIWNYCVMSICFHSSSVSSVHQDGLKKLPQNPDVIEKRGFHCEPPKNNLASKADL